MQWVSIEGFQARSCSFHGRLMFFLLLELVFAVEHWNKVFFGTRSGISFSEGGKILTRSDIGTVWEEGIEGPL